MNKYEEIFIVKHFGDCEKLKGKSETNRCKKECTNIQKKQTAKYLGLEIDSHWNFKNHIIKVITKLRQLLPKIQAVTE